MTTKYQPFQFDGNLYEQVNGVAMGSPLSPLIANTFMCSIEEKLERENYLLSIEDMFTKRLHWLVTPQQLPLFLQLSMRLIHPSISPWKQQQMVDYPLSELKSSRWIRSPSGNERLQKEDKLKCTFTLPELPRYPI